MDLTFDVNGGKYNVRVVAVIKHNGKVLLEKSEEFGFYAFPGGRVKFGETAEQAIVREVLEEFGEKPVSVRPLYVAQNLFEMGGIKFHELGFYFLVEVSDKLYQKGDFKNLDGANTFYWLDADKLQHEKVVPVYVKNNINNLPQTVQLVAIDEWNK